MEPGIRILLIDPHPAFRQAMLRFLSGVAGVEIVGQHATVAVALAEIATAAPDLIVCDPGGSGAELLGTVGRGPAAPRLILVTARDPTSQAAAALPPADAVLDKAEFGVAILPLLVLLFPALWPQLSEDTSPVRMA